MDKRIAELISSAELHIEMKNYAAAMEELAAAEEIDPDNRSIKMIKNLVSSLDANKAKPSLIRNFFAATDSTAPREKRFPLRAQLPKKHSSLFERLKSGALLK